jgi:hypothetical protein
LGRYFVLDLKPKVGIVALRGFDYGRRRRERDERSGREEHGGGRRY